MARRPTEACRISTRAWLAVVVGLLGITITAGCSPSPGDGEGRSSSGSPSRPAVSSQVSPFSMARYATSQTFCRSYFGRASAFLSAVYTQASADWITSSGSTDVFLPWPPLACGASAQAGVVEAPIFVALAPTVATALNPRDVAELAKQFADPERYTGFPEPARLAAGVYYVRAGSARAFYPQRGQPVPQPVRVKIGVFDGSVAVVYHGRNAWWCIWYDGLPVTADEIDRAQTWMALSDARIEP